tara:strand:- start:353 stop:697 length:345 start_codon:yes stop_codon:yes gene_type:complete
MCSKKEKKEGKSWLRSYVTTNFYPTYVEGNHDKVTPASAPYRTEFQSVIPRYNLSMSETRDKGTGPTFLETSYQNLKKSNNQKNTFTFPTKKKSVNNSKEAPSKKKKIRTDFWQ